jgi:hypothetical protein
MTRQTYRKIGFLLAIFSIFILSSCSKDKDKTTTPSMNFGVVAGTVYSPGKAVLPGVTVSIGDQSTTTGQNGQYILSGIAPSSKVQVNFAMEGKIPTQKIISVETDRTSRVSATLFTAYVSVHSGMEHIVIDSGVTIDIPPTTLVDADGNPFMGAVRSEVRFFDPTLPECLDAFPGTFSGIQTDGTETMFESYGFFSASFRDASNSERRLQIAEGEEVSVTAPIPYSLQANAPDIMPLWYYDDETGNWYEEGFATKVGNRYEGTVSHFSYWNFDHPVQIDEQSTITGKVVTDDGEPIGGAQVVATGISYSGYTNTYTDSQGNFSISVKANAQIKLQAFSGTNLSFFSPAIDTPAAGGSLEVADLVITNQDFQIMGSLVDTQGSPLSGYGRLSQMSPPSGEYGMNVWISCEDDGSFLATTQSISSMTSFNVMFMLETRGSLYSAAIPFLVPQPGNVWDFGEVVMRPGGNLTGRFKDNDGNFISNAWVSIMEEGGQSEENYYSASTDENGYFTISGPPNTTIRNMVAFYWGDNANMKSGSFTLNFPASGQTRNLGTITLYPLPE